MEFKLEIRSRKDNSTKLIDLIKYDQNVHRVYIEKTLERFINNRPGIIPFEYFCGTVDVLESAYLSATTKKPIIIKSKE